MVTSSNNFLLFLFQVHLHWLQITEVVFVVIRYFETQLNRLLGDKDAASQILTV